MTSPFCVPLKIEHERKLASYTLEKTITAVHNALILDQHITTPLSEDKKYSTEISWDDGCFTRWLLDLLENADEMKLTRLVIRSEMLQVMYQKYVGLSLIVCLKSIIYIMDAYMYFCPILLDANSHTWSDWLIKKITSQLKHCMACWDNSKNNQPTGIDFRIIKG